MLLLAGSQILGGNIDDTIGVDIEGNLDLRYSTGSRRDSVQSELAEGLVVSSRTAARPVPR